MQLKWTFSKNTAAHGQLWQLHEGTCSSWTASLSSPWFTSFLPEKGEGLLHLRPAAIWVLLNGHLLSTWMWDRQCPEWSQTPEHTLYQRGAETKWMRGRQTQSSSEEALATVSVPMPRELTPFPGENCLTKSGPAWRAHSQPESRGVLAVLWILTLVI